MIENEPRELTLIYHSGKSDDKKARGYVESLPSVAIKTLDLAKESISETQLAQVADKMGEPVANLIDPTYDDRENTTANKEGLRQMDTTQLLTFIKQNPKLLDTPIVIIGKRAFKLGSGYYLIKQYMAEGVNSTSDVVNPGEKKS